MADHDKLIDVIASLDRDCLSFIKEKVMYTENRSVYKKCRDIGLEWSCMLLHIGIWLLVYIAASASCFNFQLFLLFCFFFLFLSSQSIRK